MHKAVCIVVPLLVFPAQAEARHFHHAPLHHAYVHQTYLHHTYVRRAHVRYTYVRSTSGLQNFRQAYASLGETSAGMASFNSERVVGHRPTGCPNRFCGCEASLYKFGRIIPELNLASNWRRFPRATPSPGMAAVRSGHVMILQSQVSGNIWNVHDGNSGGHMTHDHARSISGYTIVDPSAASSSFMSASSGRLM